MHYDLEKIKSCIHHGELKLKLTATCSRFSPVARLDVLIANQARKRQALCFLRLNSDEQEQHLMNEPGVGRFGGDIVVVIDMNVPVIEPQVPLMRPDTLHETARRHRRTTVQAAATR